MKDVIATVHGRLGEVAIRAGCNCALCKAYRAEPTVVIATLDENRKRGGMRLPIPVRKS